MEEKIRKIVYELLRETLDDEDIEINDDSSIVTDLELSSLELSNVLAVLEKKLHIVISDSLLRKMTTVGQIVEVAMEQVK